MATSSIRGGDRAAERPRGSDVDALGPSDSSESGSDVQQQHRMPTAPDTPDELGALPAQRQSTSDAQGTGERASAPGDAEGRDGDDIEPDQVSDMEADTAEPDGDESEAERDDALASALEAELRSKGIAERKARK